MLKHIILYLTNRKCPFLFQMNLKQLKKSIYLLKINMHLPILLRNKANSQKQPSIYEDRRLKSTEDTEKKEDKGIATGQKCPCDLHRDQGSCSPGPALDGHAAGLLGDSQVNSPLPCQTRPEHHRERPGCLKSQGGE